MINIDEGDEIIGCIVFNDVTYPMRTINVEKLGTCRVSTESLLGAKMLDNPKYNRVDDNLFYVPDEIIFRSKQLIGNYILQNNSWFLGKGV